MANPKTLKYIANTNAIEPHLEYLRDINGCKTYCLCDHHIPLENWKDVYIENSSNLGQIYEYNIKYKYDGAQRVAYNKYGRDVRLYEIELVYNKESYLIWYHPSQLHNFESDSYARGSYFAIIFCRMLGFDDTFRDLESCDIPRYSCELVYDRHGKVYRHIDANTRLSRDFSKYPMHPEEEEDWKKIMKTDAPIRPLSEQQILEYGIKSLKIHATSK